MFATTFRWWKAGQDKLSLAGFSRLEKASAMASHVYSEIFLHANWHTDLDDPMLKPEIEEFAHRYITNRCRQTKGVFIHGIGGTETHVHIAIQIEPFVLISELLGELKGSSTYETNKHFARKLLAWQRGYGVVSFGKKQLPWVLDYIAHQKEHHAKGTTEERLERTEPDAEPESPAEAGLTPENNSQLPPPKGGGKQQRKAR